MYEPHGLPNGWIPWRWIFQKVERKGSCVMAWGIYNPLVAKLRCKHAC